MQRRSTPQADGPRIGVVGVGALGRHHARVVMGLSRATCSGLFDIDRSRAEVVASRVRAPVRPTLEALLEVSDGVVVAVPTTAHEEVAVAAIRAGAHVFIEKPIAPDIESADRILAEAAARGAIVQVGHVERFNPALVAARPYLDRPLFVESHRLAPFTPRSLDVAVVLDLMIHDVDLLCSLVGAPVRDVAAAGIPVLSRRVDIANARVSFDGGAVANLTASRVSVSKVRKFRVWQRSGYLSLDLAAGKGEFYRVKRGLSVLDGVSLPQGVPALDGLASVVDRLPIRGDHGEPLALELAAFRDAISGLAPPPVTGEDGRRALELALAIEQQIEDHVAYTRTASA
ncbi:MAG: Gfo/Idh/MocA family oxidoreductase [Gemmatimonadetes bacterium]|nr:Gfo/Idh/MocA family oxidoreductase [Gemmatimonadota bacterium]